MHHPTAGAPMVRAVVLNYNGDPHIFRCLEALAATEWPAGRLQVVVVDNNSTDGSPAAIAERFGSVELRPLGTNTGFPANNEALGDLDGIDYVALVNNDAFVTPGWLAPLVDRLEDDATLAAACPKLLFAPRFVELTVESPTFQPPADSRRLGVRLSGVERRGVDRWRAAQFPPPGFWGIERGRGEEAAFAWTNGHGVLRVPLEPGEVPDGTVRVRLAGPGPGPTEVTLRCGAHRSTVAVGPAPAWFELPLDATAEPFDVVQNAGSMMLAGGYGADRGFLERDTGQYDDEVDVFAWCGGGVLFRPAYLRQVGLFDERFFAYYEDTDLAWRGRAEGWRYRYVPTSVLRHQHATTSVEGSAIFNRYVERNRLMMLTKNAPRRLVAQAVWRYALTTASYARRDVVGPLRHGGRPRFGVVALRLRSFGSYLRWLPALLADRRRLRSRAVVGDDELLSWFRTER
ncbi:MAG: glycosyltransferase family 2 protein [Acidimicrobiales bacterium]